MIKKLTIIAALLLLASPLFAQHTTVTARVMDVNGNLYRTCTGGANFVGQNTTPGAPPYSLSGAPFQTTVPISCDGAGNFTISLADNLLITPTPSQWNFSICSAIGAFPGPPICFNVLITITGVTQNVTAQIQAAATLLPVSGGSLPPAGNGTHVATTNLITGGTAGNCVTWLTGGVLGDAGAACGSGGGGGTPPGSPNLSLQYNNATVFQGVSGTSFNASTGQLDVNNLANVRYATTALNWSQTIANPITGGSPSTVTLAPCPAGIDGRDNISYVYVSGVGTPEPVQMTGGGTCRPGNASGTITFTPLNSHGGGYTIGSGSQGIQETINQFSNWTGTGGSANASIVLEPTGLPVANGNQANIYTINAPVTNGGVNALTMIADGAVFYCNTRDYCILGSSALTIKGMRMASNLIVTGALVTNTACSAGVATITTGTNHNFQTGDFVDIHDTDDAFYWGGSVSQKARITVTGATTFTYPILTGNCASGGGSTRASVATSGTTNILNAAYYNPGGPASQGVVLQGLSLSVPGGSGSLATGNFNNGVVVADDEAFRVRDFLSGSLNQRSGICTTSHPYCGAEIYAPGPFSGGSGVIWITDSDITASCSANPVVLFNGNTVHLSNVITQSQAKVSVQASNRRGGFGNIILDNVYDEQGNCTNPDTGFGASAGYMFYANSARVSGGEGPQGTIPNEAVGGGTTYYYYLVPNISNDSAPFLFAQATPTGAFTLQWPRVMPAVVGTSTVTYTNPTYSIIRTTDPNTIPYTAACQGGSTSACGTIATAVVQCSTLWCSTTDNPANSTSAVTVQTFPTYIPDMMFWPGQIILSGAATLFLDSNNLLPGSGGINGAVVSLNSLTSPQVFNLRNTGNGSAWAMGFGIGNAATTFQDILTTANLKGPLNLQHNGTSIPYGEIITLVDNNQTKTLSTPIKRPTADAGDTFLGNDVPFAGPSTVGLAIGAPASIRSYINAIPNGSQTGWLESLNGIKKEFNIPTQFDQPMTSINGCFGCSPFAYGGTQVSDNFVRANGSLGGNWTNASGSCQIISNLATLNTFTGGFNWATCPYTGASFNNDQFAQGTMVGSTGGGDPAIMVRGASGAQTGYILECNGSGGAYFLLKVLAGVQSTITTGGTCTLGDVVRLGISGSTIYTFQNGKTLFATQTDSSITTGSPGIAFQNGTPGQANINQFFGGDFDQTNVFPIGTVTAQSFQSGSPVVFANLPACASGTEGTLAAITDSTTATWGATIAGGSTNHVLAYCDGTNWTVAAK